MDTLFDLMLYCVLGGMIALGLYVPIRRFRRMKQKDTDGNYCVYCGFDLRVTSSTQCPECGTDFRDTLIELDGIYHSRR